MSLLVRPLINESIENELDTFCLTSPHDDDEEEEEDDEDELNEDEVDDEEDGDVFGLDSAKGAKSLVRFVVGVGVELVLAVVVIVVDVNEAFASGRTLTISPFLVLSNCLERSINC